MPDTKDRPNMNENLRLMCVLAHPDDESLGTGGTLARYSREGVETYVVSATRGERGRYGDADPRPELHVVGQAREAELRAAAEVLGVREVTFLDYIDGDLDLADPQEATAKIAAELRRVRPHVVITFGPDGAYGHPDHIAISQLTLAAITCAADTPYTGGGGVAVGGTPHRVSKLYYMAWDEKQWAGYQAAFKTLASLVDGVERRAAPWPEWALTTVVDSRAHWETVWKAVQCHRTQITIYRKLTELPEEHHEAIWGLQKFYRVFSSVNGGRARETDLFEGLRPAG
jgi:LmbE family N-acetylglucosaminyl deacetylase